MARTGMGVQVAWAEPVLLSRDRCKRSRETAGSSQTTCQTTTGVCRRLPKRCLRRFRSNSYPGSRCVSRTSEPSRPGMHTHTTHHTLHYTSPYIRREGSTSDGDAPARCRGPRSSSVQTEPTGTALHQPRSKPAPARAHIQFSAKTHHSFCLGHHLALRRMSVSILAPLALEKLHMLHAPAAPSALAVLLCRSALHLRRSRASW